jgi:hypothetical protein
LGLVLAVSDHTLLPSPKTNNTPMTIPNIHHPAFTGTKTTQSKPKWKR